MRLLLAAATLAALAAVNPGAAFAQSYTVIHPGQPPTFINPNGNGGYSVIQPGQPPTFVNPNGNGYTVIQPGRMPTFINRNSIGDDDD